MKAWYVLQCKPNEQERAVVHLTRQNVECYYPQVTVNKMTRGKRCQVKEALFPSYMFVCFDPEVISVTSIRSTRGVKGFVQFGLKLQTVQPEIIYNLMCHEDETEQERLSESMLPKEGDVLTFVKGEFAGLEAIYSEPDGLKRTMMIITLLGKPVKVSVDNQFLPK